MKFVSEIHVSLRMNCNKFGDPLTFHVAPSKGQLFRFCSSLVYDQMPAKVMTLPSASAVFV